MPIYDFQCEKCKKGFSATLTFSEFDRKKVKCPHCSSTRIRPRLGSVNVKTSKKS